ncbi:hypothetical protein G9E11_12185 [Arthrobacter sp. IA7]|uniref:hypothetical protein n=1 Tax=Arthrobacter ipis TaxID=2716202 RepID=UPI0016884AB5|nr:hypothetical protein [Arthrobacter ipis]MBD1542990.1 hypothetical protein [Arthrobacter ipis]
MTAETETKPTTCSEDGCEKAIYSKGKCRGHYEEEREANNPLCSAAGCDRNSYVRGLCRKHYVSQRSTSAKVGLSAEDLAVLAEVVEKLGKYNKKSALVAQAREILGLPSSVTAADGTP